MSLTDRYRFGLRMPILLPVANTAAITVGDVLKIDGVAGYVTPAAAGDNNVIGVAMESCDVPTADGGVSIQVDCSDQSVYEYPPDAGTVTVALNGLTCDLGGAQSINIDASADDYVVILKALTDTNTMLVRFKWTPAGVA